MPKTPAATASDGLVVVRITAAATAAAIEAAAACGLTGEQWDADVLHAQIMPIIAAALRRSDWWWAGRTEKEPGDAGE